jgi:nicotinamidase-related amidase
MNLHFLIIDPQHDFANPNGSLFVPGADKDAERLATALRRYLLEINAIHVTLDTHHWLHIAHPIFWIDEQGHHPAPFTLIDLEDVMVGRWKTQRPHFQARAVEYIKTLQAHGRYRLTIWPPHCLIGRIGNNVVTPIAEALIEWENTFAMVNYVVKGSNMWTEHYSAIKADVPDPSDLDTHLNTQLIDSLKQADLIVCSGQALSHCVANTLRDIADYIGAENLAKIVLLQDTTSSVPGFETLGEDFLTEMQMRGMRVAKSTEFLI